MRGPHGLLMGARLFVADNSSLDNSSLTIRRWTIRRWDNLSLGQFVAGQFVAGQFVAGTIRRWTIRRWTIRRWDNLSLGQFVAETDNSSLALYFFFQQHYHCDSGWGWYVYVAWFPLSLPHLSLSLSLFLSPPSRNRSLWRPERDPILHTIPLPLSVITCVTPRPLVQFWQAVCHCERSSGKKRQVVYPISFNSGHTTSC